MPPYFIHIVTLKLIRFDSLLLKNNCNASNDPLRKLYFDIFMLSQFKKRTFLLYYTQKPLSYQSAHSELFLVQKYHLTYQLSQLLLYLIMYHLPIQSLIFLIMRLLADNATLMQMRYVTIILKDIFVCINLVLTELGIDI